MYKNNKWKYFATSHGKGIVDGVAGNAKSLVRREVMSKKQQPTIVQSSKDFADVAKKLMPNTKVLHISQSDTMSKITETMGDISTNTRYSKNSSC